MKILTSKKALSTKELAGVLKRGLPKKYSYELFGLDSEQSIIVRKSPFVGAQISHKGNELTIQGIAPSKASWPFILIAMLMSGIPHIANFLFGSKWVKLESELAIYLNHELN